MLLIRAGPLRVKPDPAAAVWVSRAGWLRSGTFPWYRDSPVHIRDFPLSVGGPWAQSESRPRVCPEQTPAFFGGGWDGRSPAGEGPRLHAGLLEGSPCAPVRVCDPMCEHRAGLCFQMCLCIRVHTCAWSQLAACTCVSRCAQVRVPVHVCVTVGLWGTRTPPGGAGREAMRHRKTPQAPVRRHTWPQQSPPRKCGVPGQGGASPVRDGVIPEHADRLGALLGLQEGVLHQDGPLQGAGQRGPLAVHHGAHHGCVDDGPVRQPAGEKPGHRHKPVCSPDGDTVRRSLQEGPNQAHRAQSCGLSPWEGVAKGGVVRPG